jgi:hypothetical protein
MLHFRPSQPPWCYRPQINNCRGTQIMRLSILNFAQPHAFSFSCTPPQEPVLNRTVHDLAFISDTLEVHVDLHFCRPVCNLNRTFHDLGK